MVNNSGKLSIECNFNGLADFRTKLFTFHTKPNVEIASHQILYVVIHFVRSFLKRVSCIIQIKLFVGLAHGLNTIQRSGDLCLVTIYDIVPHKEWPQIHFFAFGYLIWILSKKSKEFCTRPSIELTHNTICTSLNKSLISLKSVPL